MTKHTVTVIGNVGIDTNVYLPGADIDFSVEANFTENIDTVGQAGGYTSRGFARLGWPTAFIGYVGDDMGGRFIRDVFAEEGIDTNALFTDPAGTSRSINLMYCDGRRKNFYDGKSHMLLQPDLAACRSVMEGTKLAHFNIPNWARALLPIARECGAIISCDIQDVVSLDDPYRQDFIHHADILFFSAANFDNPTPLIEACLRRKPEQVVVVGIGARGCALGTTQGIRFFAPLDLFGPVVDTNGAGDGLAVGFLAGFVLLGQPLEIAVQQGQIAARFTCAQKAPKQLISREALERR